MKTTKEAQPIRIKLVYTKNLCEDEPEFDVLATREITYDGAGIADITGMLSDIIAKELKEALNERVYGMHELIFVLFARNGKPVWWEYAYLIPTDGHISDHFFVVDVIGYASLTLHKFERVAS